VITLFLQVVDQVELENQMLQMALVVVQVDIKLLQHFLLAQRRQ
jgi:hypothetical protein